MTVQKDSPLYVLECVHRTVEFSLLPRTEQGQGRTAGQDGRAGTQSPGRAMTKVYLQVII